MIVEGKNKSETQNQNNIWNEILRESMTKKDLEESNVFIFGDKFSGKRSLIKHINRELLQKGELEGKLYKYHFTFHQRIHVISFKTLKCFSNNSLQKYLNKY